MKKYLLLIVIIATFYFGSYDVYGITDNFKYVIDTIGVPQFNVFNEEINEEVYYTYNVLCYSSPLDASVGASQGFVEVSNGKWTSNNTKYNGSGIPGEFYYLGTQYNGQRVSNVYYPVSFFPDSTPEYWNYMYMNGAVDSWNDKSKYKYVEQLEHMKSKKILYDTLNFETRKTDPYNLINYNITPREIGFDKIMLDTCSTWKTNGIMNVVRRDLNGGIRYAIFATEPMAASANVKSNLLVNDNYIIDENELEKKISITYGAEAVNLTDYAKYDHIKEIKSTLYINGEIVSSISLGKTKEVNKSYIYTLSRENANSYPLYIEVKSTMYTEFAVDGLMQDGLSKSVNVDVKNYKRKIEDIQLSQLIKNDNNYYVCSLIETDNTKLASSTGIIQCGNHLCIKVSSDYNVEDIAVKLNGMTIDYNVLVEKNGKYIISFVVPDELISLQSWNYLRMKKDNYFKVNQNDVGIREKQPNEVTVTVKGESKSAFFDAIDNYNSNLNYTMNNVRNIKEINEKIELNDW